MVSPFLGKIVPDLSATWNAETKENFKLKSSDNQLMEISDPLAVAGAELGLWNMLGITANIYGLSQTSSDHGAFLTQLTTLLVPTARGIMGVPIPSRIWTAIRLALAGVFMFTQDPSQSDCTTLQGDLLCAIAAIFYATYDLWHFKWGKDMITLVHWNSFCLGTRGNSRVYNWSILA